MHRQLRAKDIVAARTLAGLSQSQLAALLGVVQTTVSRWELGIQVPNASQRLKLIQFLDEARVKRPVECIVAHSPFTMALVTRAWTIIAASPKLAELNGATGSKMHGLSFKNIATVEMEQMILSLDQRGFFDGSPNVYRIIARGVYMDGRPCAVDATTTPIRFDGEIAMVNQIKIIDDLEYASLRRQYDLITLLE